ncbi:porin family protein [Marinobacter sp. R17]|uniref:outer membrane beta-barrel protein n=1 Tax=Marinobacter sp. R17 TaxID=2484250 RepID=UPI000F4BE80C|nr:outer membrane beta-barrel protein [Marinobacter sp. R17]ROT99548.1 porin family protein [Marinobacter sp. R17]
MTTQSTRRSLLALTLASGLVSLSAHAQEPPKSRAGLDYVGVQGMALQYRKVGGLPEGRGWLSAGTLVLGSHISDLFHVEVRAGAGLDESEVSENLKVDMDWFASWYMGVHYGLTDFSNVYAQVGFSHIVGNAKVKETEDTPSAYEDLDDEFPGSSFAFSWLAGIDLKVVDNTYLVLEGGRLFEDTDSSASGYQFNGGVRYEF